MLKRFGTIALKDSWAYPRLLSQANETGLYIADMFARGPYEHLSFRTTVKLEGYQVEESIWWWAHWKIRWRGRCLPFDGGSCLRWIMSKTHKSLKLDTGMEKRAENCGREKEEQGKHSPELNKSKGVGGWRERSGWAAIEPGVPH